MTQAPKNPMVFIRKHIFGASQSEFANLLGYTQPAVAKWERNGYCQYQTMLDIRALATKRGLDWNSDYFFETPTDWSSKNGRGRKGH